MKIIRYISVLFLLLSLSTAHAQHSSSSKLRGTYPVRNLTIEPAIGFNPSSMGNLLVSNVIQWNPKKRISLISYSAYSYNNSMIRNFNHIRTDYNYTLSQKVGIGTTLYGRHTSHSFALLGGVKYDAFKETLVNPEFEEISASMHSVSPDFGIQYNWKIGTGKYFFSYRMFLPVYPYPIKTFDINSITGNISNITMEFGVGVRIK